VRLFGIAGYSGSGKTTLIEKMLPLITAQGLRVSVLKHTHHDFDIDRPGKDSYRHRQAGAHEVLLAGSARWVLLSELRAAPEPTLGEYLERFAPCDLVLVEGFKKEAIPKLEVHRAATGQPPLWPDDRWIVAVAADYAPPCTLRPGITWFNVDDVTVIARFVLASASAGEEQRVVL
jgi:molybdopterin-guanine dinucleotide biosynthesis protein B